MTLPWHLPVVLGATTLTPSGAALALTGGTPTLIAGTVITPTGASLTLTAGTPAVNVGILLTPTGASLTLTAGTPTVAVTNNVVITPTGASLALTAGTPTVTATGSIVITPTGASLALTAGTPAISNTLLITPTGASLTLTGGTPQVILPTGPITPTGAILGLFPGTPTLTIGAYFDSFRVAAISMADYVQPVYTGTGARIYRASTGTVTPVHTVSGTPALLPSNTFDTIDICTADVTPNLTNGGFVVETAGWFRVNARLGAVNSLSSADTTGSGASFGLGIWKNGSYLKPGQSHWGALIGSWYDGPDALYGDFTVKLDVGDSVQLGNWVDTNNMFNFLVTGESTGALTYMEITLQNKAGSGF